jgi:hypothetical protein
VLFSTPLPKAIGDIKDFFTNPAVAAFIGAFAAFMLVSATD